MPSSVLRRALPLCGLLLAFAGCSLLDEIEDPNPPPKPAPEETAAAPGEPAPDPRAEWWKSARTLGPAERGGEDGLVSCRLAGQKRFMRRNDCLSQGGRPDA